MEENRGQVILYKSQDGKTEVDVIMMGGSVWLTQKQMGDLFSVDTRTINEHLKNIFETHELEPDSTIRKNRIVQNEGGRQVTREVNFYNLDAIISVGYRVNTYRGTQFRIWATQNLKEYLVKGFVIDDDRLAGNKKSYFEELQERVRAIRTSEKMFYEKIKEIFATSEDYLSTSEVAKRFFAAIQNTFHYAIHQHTAAELIMKRADADKANMGLSTWKDAEISKEDVQIAKNYLTEMELKKLNLLCDQFLSFAELQSLEQRPMFMRDWAAKLVAFLQLNEKPILKDAGKVSSDTAKTYALAQYNKLLAESRKQAEKLKEVIQIEGTFEDDEIDNERNENSISFGDAMSKIANAGKAPS